MSITVDQVVLHLFGILYEDLQRRDFTMNAIAMDTAYKLYDYFDGQQDINNRIIRTVGIAEERFQEDALRIIRMFKIPVTIII